MCNQRPCKCSCDLKRIEPGDDPYGTIANAPAGTFTFIDQEDGEHRYKSIYVQLPYDGGNGFTWLPLYTGEARPHDRFAFWKWDGSIEKPTITPSILVKRHNPRTKQKDELWHGFITAGRAVSC